MESNIGTSWRPLRVILIIVSFGILSQLESSADGGIPIELILFGQVALSVWLVIEIVQAFKQLRSDDE